MSEKTIFSKIIEREIPADIVYETDTLIAFHDINPQAPVHILIVPKKPIPKISELSDDDAPLMGEMMLAARTIAQQEGLVDDGFRLVINTGPNANQTVLHVHMHLLGGRSMAWPPG
ncbi:MAG: histidine triad nucleotide-binding protein [Chloroflexi bacterium]|nr:histidine triad nucleotide-binding protein [Chloroflexota bacterium]